jgi:hypothetical protein
MTAFPHRLLLRAYKYRYVQGDTEGNVNVLMGGDSIGHFDKKYLCEHVCNCE